MIYTFLVFNQVVQPIQEVQVVQTTPGTTTTTTSTTPRPPYVYTYDKNQVINEILSVSWNTLTNAHSEHFCNEQTNFIAFFLLHVDPIPCIACRQ